MDSSYKKLPDQITINEFKIDFETGKISTDTKAEVIEPKVMDLLRVLCDAPKHVHSAEALFEKVWPNSIYSPNSVRRNIALLRQALCDEDKKLIQTHPKRGYSLEASIELIECSNVKKVQYHSNNESEKGAQIKKRPLALVLVTAMIIVVTCLVVLIKNEKSDIQLSNLRPITSSNDIERYMQVSPDGRYMAYIQSGANQRRLLMKDLVTHNEWALNKETKPYTYLAWDIHLNSIVYSLQEQNGISFNRILLDAQRKPISEQELFNRKDITWNSMFFVDNEQNLYYLANLNSSEHSRNATLYRHNLASGLYEPLLEPNDEFKPYKIALSPSQKNLALIGFNRLGISEIQILNLNSQKVTLVGEVDHNWHFLTWFEDESAILLSNGSQLKTIALNGKVNLLSYKSLNFLVYPQIVKDSLYFVEAKKDQDILITKLNEPSAPIGFINSNTVDMFPTVSGDKKMVAYVSLKNGLPQMFIKDLRSNQSRLIFPNQNKEYALSKPIWDSTNKRIVSSINNKPFIVHLDETHHRIEWLKDIIGLPKAWYRQSDAILLVDKTSHDDNLVRFDLSTHQVRLLGISMPSQQVFIDNDDDLLIFSGDMVFDANTGMTLLNDFIDIKYVYPQRNGFYFITNNEDKMDLHFYEYESKKVIMVKGSNQNLEQICSKQCDQIIGIVDDILLIKHRTGFADILQLQITTE